MDEPAPGSPERDISFTRQPSSRFRLRDRRTDCSHAFLELRTYGLDLHEGHINLARILAAENGVPSTAFIWSTEAPGIGGELPFEDSSFDIVMLLSVLEHMSDAALSAALPEIHRIFRGVVYVLVPNRLKTVDDHTDLKGVCWMPRWLAAAYVKMRGGAVSIPHLGRRKPGCVLSDVRPDRQSSSASWFPGRLAP